MSRLLKKENNEVPTKTMYVQQRYIILLLAHFGLFTTSILKSNISIAIVSMVNTTRLQGDNISAETSCPRNGETYNTVSTNQTGDFSWSSVQQGLVLGSYFYGYLIMQIPGAWLSQSIGPKKVIGVAMFLGGILTIGSPITAKSSFELFVALRALLGFIQGAIYSTMVGIWNSWAPPSERTIFISITLAGNSFGPVVIFPLGGYIAETLGWEKVFYTTGGWAMLWTLCWMVLMYDCPTKHPWISDKEKEYIETSIGNIGQTKRTKTPWVEMIKSIPMLAIICAHFADSWTGYTLGLLLPTYMSTILNFDLTSSGALSAIPYLLQLLSIMLIGYITDVIRKRKLTSTVMIRKINSTIGLLVPGGLVVLAGYVGCNATAAVTLFCLSFLFTGFLSAGFKTSTADIAPQFGGITFALSNTFANIPGFLAPQVAGILLLENNEISQWQYIFWICAGFSLLGAVIFVIFGSSEEQSWAKTSISSQNQEDLPLSNNKTESV